MHLPERVGTEACSLSRRWEIDPTLAAMLVALDGEAAQAFSSPGVRWPGLSIISGYRPPTVQSRVNPSAPNSLHTFCPALAADLRVGDQPASRTDPTVWAWLGRRWAVLGGRWGGTFHEPDFNHFDVPPLGGVILTAAET